MDKTLVTVIMGMAGTLITAGILWMVSTLVIVDKRTEVMDVKMDHLVQIVENLSNNVDELSTQKVNYDQPWTNVFPSIQASGRKN